MRRWMKRIGIICLIPMVLVILISILLYIPPFQNFAVRLATEYASETTGMNIRIGQIRLSFPLNLTIRDMWYINGRVESLPLTNMRYINGWVESIVLHQLWWRIFLPKGGCT